MAEAGQAILGEDEVPARYVSYLRKRTVVIMTQLRKRTWQEGTPKERRLLGLFYLLLHPPRTTLHMVLIEVLHELAAQGFTYPPAFSAEVIRYALYPQVP